MHVGWHFIRMAIRLHVYPIPVSHAFPSAAPGTGHNWLLQDLCILPCGKEGESGAGVLVHIYIPTYGACFPLVID